ncbi:unnamed protein product [Cyclocybe aegerita]|uniref:DUF6533 domain-containing protein n=1 Tax=Cyclocybe aegerita TaxID=1973307 RepID=A0A8S0W739_CYCAE|nr:unnamed protein product [Cyclocybe aegerita]
MAAQNLSSIDPSTLPNPFNPLAFLPPHVAFQASFTLYVAICCLAVIIWDILHTIAADYQLAFKQRFTRTTLAYFLSRYSTLGYLIGKCIQLTAELPNCHILETIMCAFYTLTHATTGLLLYFRVCAVYNNNLFVRIFFGITWLGVIGCASVTFGGLVGEHIGPTQFCTSRVTKKYIPTPWLMDFVNDTLVFVAIMWKLSSDVGQRLDDTHARPRIGVSAGKGSKTGNGSAAGRRFDWRAMKLINRPTSLQRLTDVFLQDSQVFYLIAVAMNFATIITYFVINNPPDSPFRIMLVFPNTIIVNIMACRVYRNMKLGRPGLLPSSTGPSQTRPDGSGANMNFNVPNGTRGELGAVYHMENLRSMPGNEGTNDIINSKGGITITTDVRTYAGIGEDDALHDLEMGK